MGKAAKQRGNRPARTMTRTEKALSLRIWGTRAPDGDYWGNYSFSPAVPKHEWSELYYWASTQEFCWRAKATVRYRDGAGNLLEAEADGSVCEPCLVNDLSDFRLSLMDEAEKLAMWDMECPQPVEILSHHFTLSPE